MAAPRPQAQLRQPHSIIARSRRHAAHLRHRQPADPPRSIRRPESSTTYAGTGEAQAGAGRCAGERHAADRSAHARARLERRPLPRAARGQCDLSHRSTDADAASDRGHRQTGLRAATAGRRSRRCSAGPRDWTLDGDRYRYAADTENHAVRRIDLKSRVITTVVGTGKRGDGPEPSPLACLMSRPHGVLFAKVRCCTFPTAKRTASAWCVEESLRLQDFELSRDNRLLLRVHVQVDAAIAIRWPLAS